MRSHQIENSTRRQNSENNNKNKKVNIARTVKVSQLGYLTIFSCLFLMATLISTYPSQASAAHRLFILTPSQSEKGGPDMIEGGYTEGMGGSLKREFADQMSGGPLRHRMLKSSQFFPHEETKEANEKRGWRTILDDRYYKRK